MLLVGNTDKMSRLQNRIILVTVTVVVFFICYSQFSVTADNEPENKQDETASLIEAATYTRHEFFGAQAIVPYPTAEARNRLAAVLPPEQQGSVVLAIRTDDPGDELVRYTTENGIDLAIVQAGDAAGRALVERGKTSVLLLR